jgi:hypothetical protein
MGKQFLFYQWNRRVTVVEKLSTIFLSEISKDVSSFELQQLHEDRFVFVNNTNQAYIPESR